MLRSGTPEALLLRNKNQSPPIHKAGDFLYLEVLNMLFYSFGLWHVSLKAQPPHPQEHELSPLFFFMISLAIIPITTAAIINEIINVGQFISAPPSGYFISLKLQGFRKAFLSRSCSFLQEDKRKLQRRSLLQVFR